MHLVGYLYEDYYDARLLEHKVLIKLSWVLPKLDQTLQSVAQNLINALTWSTSSTVLTSTKLAIAERIT
jgi:hypothetical protein